MIVNQFLGLGPEALVFLHRAVTTQWIRLLESPIKPERI